MVNKTRTTISIPPDLAKEIERIRRNMPQLSRNEVLFMLARRGVVESQLPDLESLFGTVTLIKDSLNAGSKGASNEALVQEIRKNRDFILHTFILMRHFVLESHPGRGKDLFEKASQDLNNLKRKPNEQS